MSVRAVRTLSLVASVLFLTPPSPAALPPHASPPRPGTPVETRLTAPRGRQTAVAARGAQVLPESRTETDELRVIVRASGEPLILEPAGAKGALAALRDLRLEALDRIADDIVRTDNEVRTKLGKAARQRAQVVTRRYTYVWNGLAASVHRETVAKLRALPGVTGVWIDQQKRAALADSVPLIRADQVWNQLGYRGSGITVAVVDTGVDYTRPDLGGCFGEGCKVEAGYDLANDDPDPMDDYGHGTHVAGIVAANGVVKGVAPQALIWAFKVLDQYGSGYDSTIIAGIEMAANPDGNPATPDGAKIINMSLGGPGDPDDPLSQASDNAMAGGTLVVVAAGNSGPSYNTLGSPGCARQVLTVGASDKSDQMAWFSSLGPAPTTWQIKPEVIAPGVAITSTVPTGACILCDPTGYLALDGTSMATPHVAGAAALVIERYPSWTPAQVKAAIMQKLIDFTYGAYVQGAGRLDAWNAITPRSRADVASFSPGLDDPAQATWTRSQTFTLTNLGGSSRSYALSVDGTFPPGLAATVTPGSVTIPGQQSRSFTFTLTVDNALVPNVPADPFSYEGTIRATAAAETLHFPFAFLKAPALTLDFDQVPWIVAITDNASWWKYLTYPPTSFSILVPDVSFDVVTMFPDAVSYVFHEGLHLTTSGQVSIARAEAVHPFTVVPVDRDGAPLTLTTSMTLVHLGPKSHFFDTYSLSDLGGSFGSTTTFYLSSMSDRYDFDVSVLQEPGGTDPTYLYYGAALQGVHAPMTFRSTPGDFRHVTWGYKVDPGRSVAFPVTWLSARPYNTAAIIAFGACDATPAIPAPFRRDVYLTPLPGDQAGAGFLKQSVFGATPPAPCEWLDYLFETPYVAALSTTELDLWSMGNPEPVVRTANPGLTSGIGPFRWTGNLFNSSDQLFAYGESGPWFLSQMYDVRPYAPLPYDLLQGGDIVQSGTLSGTDTNLYLQVPVTPGRYTLHVPFTQWFLGSAQGRADAFAAFDTQSADPNPPTLRSLMVEHGGAFTDLLPPTGGTVSFRGADDSGDLVDVRLYYKTSGGFEPATVSGDAATGYTATVPAPGGPAPTGPLAVLLRDGSGNELSYGYCSAATATVEVCDGFDDDCDGVLLPGESDGDGDTWRGCAGDCDDADGSIWGKPSEVPDLRIDAGTALAWGAPLSGAQPGAMLYDVLRSIDPRDFVTGATCVVSQSGSRAGSDPVAPGAGAVFFYQVRASDACPDGRGSMGARSDGTPRVGRSCP